MTNICVRTFNVCLSLDLGWDLHSNQDFPRWEVLGKSQRQVAHGSNPEYRSVSGTLVPVGGAEPYKGQTVPEP